MYYFSALISYYLYLCVFYWDVIIRKIYIWEVYINYIMAITGNSQGNDSPLLNSDFDECLSVCNSEHLSYCNCQRDTIMKYVKEFAAADIEYNRLVALHEKGEKVEFPEGTDLQRLSIYGNTLLEERKDNQYYLIKKILGKRYTLADRRCHIEKKEIQKTIKLFVSNYDIKDIRVYTIVQSVINHQLSALRMQKYSNLHGILQTIYDEHGNKRLAINPVEAEKRKFDEAKVKAIDILSRMIEGINVNLKTVKIQDVLGTHTDSNEIVGEFREIE